MYSQILNIFKIEKVKNENVFPPKWASKRADLGVSERAADRGHSILGHLELYPRWLHRPILLRRGGEGGYW